MREFFQLLKRGNRSAMLAGIVNLIIALFKGIVYLFTGNVAIFAETLRSFGDTANQLFVFIGSALSKKTPTERFPNGFGRLVNLVLLGAVLIVGIMAFEAFREGYSHIVNKSESNEEGFLLNIAVLVVATLLDFFVLYKVMIELTLESKIKPKGFAIFTESVRHLRKATPATKLVFMEDLVATIGGIVAVTGVLITRYTSFYQAEGIASIIIALMMFLVVGKLFLDNAAGVIGQADEEMKNKIGALVMKDPDVKDIQGITVIKEGEDLHVELEIEVDPQLTVAAADDIKDRLEEQIMAEKGVVDVTIEFDEEDGIPSWNRKLNSGNE